MNPEKSNVTLFICNYSSLYGGNFIASIRQLAMRINKMHGEKVIVFAFPKKASEQAWCNLIKEKYCVVFYNENQYKKDIKNIIKKVNPGILYTHFVSPKDVLFFKKAAKPYCKVVSHIHSDFSNSKKTSFVAKIKSVLYFLCLKDIVQIFVGNSINNIFKSKRHYVIPNALCLERENSNNIEVNRATLGIDKDDIVIEVFGWSPFTKGVDVAIDAVANLINFSSRHIVLLIITDEDKATEDFIVNKYGQIPQYVKLAKPVSDVFVYHKMADIFLSASRSEGFSYSTLEAIFIGKTVVISDIPGTSWAQSFAGVFVFKNKDILDLANTLATSISYFLENPITERKKFGDKCMNIEEWCDSIMEVLYEK